MKSLISLFSLILFLTLLSSCGDDDPVNLDNYTCTCSYYNGTETVTEVYDVGPKADIQSATADCDEQAVSLDNLGATNINCNATKD